MTKGRLVASDRQCGNGLQPCNNRLFPPAHWSSEVGLKAAWGPTYEDTVEMRMVIGSQCKGFDMNKYEQADSGDEICAVLPVEGCVEEMRALTLAKPRRNPPLIIKTAQPGDLLFSSGECHHV